MISGEPGTGQPEGMTDYYELFIDGSPAMSRSGPG